MGCDVIMRLLPLEYAKPRDFLAKTIFDNDGRILLREGVALTDFYLSRIKRLQIYSIYYWWIQWVWNWRCNKT